MTERVGTRKIEAGVFTAMRAFLARVEEELEVHTDDVENYSLYTQEARYQGTPVFLVRCSTRRTM